MLVLLKDTIRHDGKPVQLYTHSHFFSRHTSDGLECLQNSEFLLHYIPNPRSRDSVGGLVTRLWAHGQVKAVRFRTVARDFSCKYPDWFSRLPILKFHALRGLFPKRWRGNGGYAFTPFYYRGQLRKDLYLIPPYTVTTCTLATYLHLESELWRNYSHVVFRQYH